MIQQSKAILIGSALLCGQSVGGQRVTGPPVRQLGPVIARAKDSIGAVFQLVQLSDGRVVVNDNRWQRLVILDSALAHSVVVLDTSGTAKRAYPAQRGGTVLRYVGDSILFADPVAQAFLVIDPAGSIVRDIAFPAGDAPLVGTGFGNGTRSDQQGRIVYWTTAGRPCGDVTTQDSIPLLRSDLRARTPDTVGIIHLYKRPCPASTSELGIIQGGPPVPFFPRRDEWAVLRDGSIAIVREHDYSIDWIDSDGTHRHTERVATDWHRLVDSEKAAILDTVRAFYTKRADSTYTAVLADPRYAQLSAETKKQITKAAFLPEFVDPSTLPDYLHAFQNPVRADGDGNLWIPEAVNQILPSPPGAAPPQLVYDIVNRQGLLTDRVQLPGGTALVGFGPGVVYLTSREGAGIALVRVRVR